MKTVVDNFPEVSKLLRFNKNENAFLVWVVRRPKDGNTKAHGNNRNRTIKSYYIQNQAQLDEKKEEIVALCDAFNCRAYICMNPRKMKNVLFSMQTALLNKTHDDSGITKIDLLGIIDHAFMKTPFEGERYWVVDVDDKDPAELAAIVECANDARSEFKKNVIDVLPTVSGYHLITHRFDSERLTTMPVDIKKDALTLLYANIDNELTNR